MPKPPAKRESNGAPSTALAHYAIVKTDVASLQEVLRANVGSGGINEFTLDRVRVPAGGGQIWTVPTLEGTIDAKEIEGVIVAWKEARAYWRIPFAESGGGSPPDCASRDAFIGFGDPGGDCLKCPLAQFGSADARKAGQQVRAQACKHVIFLFVLQPTSMLPLVVSCPPTSLHGTKAYLLRLAANNLPYYSVVTKITLAADKNQDGIKYSRIDYAMAGRLTPEEATKIKAYGAAFKPTVEGAVVQPADIRE